MFDIFTSRIVKKSLNVVCAQCTYLYNNTAMCAQCTYSYNNTAVCAHFTYSTLQVYQRSNSQVRHIPPKMSDKFESQHSLRIFAESGVKHQKSINQSHPLTCWSWADNQIIFATCFKNKFESQHSLSPTIWSDIMVFLGRTWEWIFKDFFFTFLEVNMSNILWTMRICKHTFFPVCRMCGVWSLIHLECTVYYNIIM
jgi:hypothetical protein